MDPQAAQKAQARLIRTRDNYTAILLLLTEIIASPRQDQIDALCSQVESSGLVRPKVTYTEDGATYNWTEYQTFVIQQLETLEKTIQIVGGPFEVRTRGVG